MVPVFFGLLSRVLVAYNLERDGMPLHDAVEVNCKKSATSEYQDAGAYGIWAMGCLLDNCKCVIGIDMTTTPYWRERLRA